MNTEDWRAQIDEVDTEILRLLNRRARLAEKLGPPRGEHAPRSTLQRAGACPHIPAPHPAFEEVGELV